LGFVAIDEQHRFGVLQRKRLMDKAVSHGHAPHVLVLTATPIPRTLSLTLYGDLDVSVLDELPPGRTPIVTRSTSEPHLPGVWEFLRREVGAGHQAYVVYPVIEESKLELKAAIEEFEKLSKQIFPQLRVGLLHGRLPRDEKDDVMQRFRKNDIQVLVSTTVIEVGVDVPNATVMVIEHAERFGLAQLHQLRGRIGRGGGKSHCILVALAMVLKLLKPICSSAVRENFLARASPAISAFASPTLSATANCSSPLAVKPSRLWKMRLRPPPCKMSRGLCRPNGSAVITLRGSVKRSCASLPENSAAAS
jgi:Helicase conserved C-terminal domain